MRRTLGIMSLLCVFVLSLTACSKQADPVAGGTPEGGAPTLPTVMQMLVGTFKLEGTDQAVDAEQAAKLLPLWKAYNSLSSSDSVAQKEVTALVKQIENTMTSKQRQAITEMKLSFQDMSAVARAQGIEMAMGSPGQRGAGGAQGAMPEGGMPPEAMGGGMPGGGMPGGGGGGMPPGGGGPGGGGPGGFGGGQSSSESSSVTNFGPQGTTALIEALIKLLETKVASS